MNEKQHLHAFSAVLLSANSLLDSYSPNGAAGCLVLVLSEQCLVPADALQGCGCCPVAAVLPAAAAHCPHDEADDDPQEDEGAPAATLSLRRLACSQPATHRTAVKVKVT